MSRTVILFAVVAFVITACSASLPADGSTISWLQAVELLRGGHVTAVMQAHSLDVWLTLTNGASVHTVEPYIDAIFDEVQACGQPCEGMSLATE